MMRASLCFSVRSFASARILRKKVPLLRSCGRRRGCTTSTSAGSATRRTQSTRTSGEHSDLYHEAHDGISQVYSSGSFLKQVCHRRFYYMAELTFYYSLLASSVFDARRFAHQLYEHLRSISAQVRLLGAHLPPHRHDRPALRQLRHQLCSVSLELLSVFDNEATRD